MINTRDEKCATVISNLSPISKNITNMTKSLTSLLTSHLLVLWKTNDYIRGDFRRITWSEPGPLWTTKNSLWRSDSELRKKECFELEIGNHGLNRFEIRNLGPDCSRPWLKFFWKWPSEKKPFRWLWVIEALFLNQALILVSIFSTKITCVSSYQIF